MAKRREIKLTAEQLCVLETIEHGADVWGYYEARILREVQALHPHLLRIVKAQNPPANGAAQQPYFGAILTKAGLNYLRGSTVEDFDTRRRRAA